MKLNALPRIDKNYLLITNWLKKYKVKVINFVRVLFFLKQALWTVTVRVRFIVECYI